MHTDIGHACVGALIASLTHFRNPLRVAKLSKLLPRRAHGQCSMAQFCCQLKSAGQNSPVIENLKREDSINLGRRLLNHALGAGNKLTDIPQANIDAELARMKLHSIDDLLAEIGLGNAMSVVVARNLQNNPQNTPEEQVLVESRNKLSIKGADGVLITFAKCCRPIPGDPIVAHISPGKGLVIHHESCRNIRGYQKNLINLWLLNGTTTLIPTLSLKLKWI